MTNSTRITRAVGTSLAGGLIAAAILATGPAFAQKITVVLSRSLPPYQEALKGLSSMGAFQIQVVNLEGDLSKISTAYQTIADQGADGVVVFGAAALDALKEKFPAQPVIYTMLLEPMTFPPERRVSGVVMQIPVKDQIGRIPQLLPNAKIVGVLYNPQYSKKIIADVRDMVAGFGLTLFPVAVDSQAEAISAVANLTNSSIDVLWSVVDNTTAQPDVVSQVIRSCLDRKIPYIGLSVFHVKAGALAAFSTDYQDLGKQTGELAKAMIAGTAAAGQVETPRKVVIYVNGDTQKRLGISLGKTSEVQVLQ